MGIQKLKAPPEKKLVAFAANVLNSFVRSVTGTRPAAICQFNSQELSFPRHSFRTPKTEMAETPFIIQERQFQRIKSILARLCVECAARVVFLVDRDGQPIAFHGDIGDMDTTSFSSLAAGNVAATTSMAKLIGEDEFPAVVHEGERESIYIGVIGRSLLVVVFDERSTVGLVKIRSKRASFEIAAAIQEVIAESATFRNNNNAFFAEITDDDIDSLFAQ